MKVFFCKFDDPIYVKLAKLEIMFRLASEINIHVVLPELKEYATEVDVDFVRKSVRSIGRCAIKISNSADKCIEALVELVETKVNYVVQEAVVVIKDIFRKYPNKYESIISVLCDNLDSLDEPEAKASMIWIIGQYADRIDNADTLLEEFLDNFSEEPAEVQLALLTAIVKLFIKRPSAGQELVPKVLKWSTEDVDNPDLRDRGFIYWRLLSTDPVAAKVIILGDKPTISTETDNMEPALVDELLLHVSNLASIYHKPPGTFLGGVKERKIRPSNALVMRTFKKEVREPWEEMNGSIIYGDYMSNPYATDVGAVQTQEEDTGLDQDLLQDDLNDETGNDIRGAFDTISISGTNNVSVTSSDSGLWQQQQLLQQQMAQLQLQQMTQMQQTQLAQIQQQILAIQQQQQLIHTKSSSPGTVFGGISSSPNVTYNGLSPSANFSSLSVNTVRQTVQPQLATTTTHNPFLTSGTGASPVIGAPVTPYTQQVSIGGVPGPTTVESPLLQYTQKSSGKVVLDPFGAGFAQSSSEPSSSASPVKSESGKSVISDEMFKVSPYVPPKRVWLTAAAGNGMEIGGVFLRFGGQMVLDLVIVNKSAQSLSDFAILFNKNSFGLAPASQLDIKSPLRPNQTLETRLLLKIEETSKQLTSPIDNIQVALKCTAGIVYFQTSLPLHLLFDETGTLDAGTWLGLWNGDSQLIANETSESFKVALEGVGVDVVMRKLLVNNVFTVADRVIDGVA
ncbi:AP-1 complex subunit beta-1, partial [Nowakowskiella sp. JEL0078]